MLLTGYYFYSHLGQLKFASSYHLSVIFLISSATGGVKVKQKAVPTGLFSPEQCRRMCPLLELLFYD